MSEVKTVDLQKKAANTGSVKTPTGEKPTWETPKLEDVSEQVMAQPYIRFT